MAPSTQKRIALPINQNAAQAANGVLKSETGGRLPDPAAPEDFRLRERWLSLYALYGGKLESDQSSTCSVGATTAPCAVMSIRLEYLHADGTPVKGARYIVESPKGEVWYTGTLDKNGRAQIDNVPPERSSFVYYFLEDLEIEELHVKPSATPDKEAPKAVYESMLDWIWGTLQGDFNPDPTISQIAVNTALGLFPVVDQALDVRDIIAGLKHLIEYYAESKSEQSKHKPIIGLDYEVYLWLNLFIIALGCIPEIGSLVKGVLKGLITFIHRKGAHAITKLAPELWWYLLKIFNFFGKSNAHEWLKRLPDNMGKWMDEAAAKIKQSLDTIQEALNKGKEHANGWLARTFASKQQIAALIETCNRIQGSIQKTYSALDAMKARINQWLRDQIGQLLLGKSRRSMVGRASTNAEPHSNIVRQEAQEPPRSLPEVPPPHSLRPVQPLDVNSYGNQTQRSIKGDRLENDHIPSFAASKKAAEKQLGRELTKDEATKLRNHLTSITEPEEVHKNFSRTYFNKNNAGKVAEDAQDLQKAARNDMEALRDALGRSGTSSQVEEAFKAIEARNKSIGLYDDMNKLLNSLGIKK
ncbi:filamentous hemagglutinin [Cystobacter fuscus DSM 2262]|uniref:Filamentous hemagglutinin n=1 Tax=Cystobacter fuscus (strain ATCC 25194 / DSM 2262 / NBRC 100088 / M29) TaxID=1242864 RepID=S9QIT6_CYSF2|nr:hypothetical protein [Cystobacter fuscus]EPX61169.1 filamentous hemagglutinin [Cystobacter fuscus DSM 2262]